MTGLMTLKVACAILIALTLCGRNCSQKNSNEEACCGKDQCCPKEASCCKYGEPKKCCDKNLMACCEGYGCVAPCESQFDTIGCQLAELSLSSAEVDGSLCRLGKTLFRLLRPDENPLVGIVAKNPHATKTVLSHVNCGSRLNYKSQYISATTSLPVAQHYKALGEKKGLTDLRIAEIDLDALPKSCALETVDLTSEENRHKYLGNAVCKNFAKASCEVLLKCDVPIPCHVIEPPEEEKKSLKDGGEL